MMKYLIGLLCLFSVAQAQFAPTSAKTKFVNGIGIGSKDTSQFTAADTIALTIARDSVMYYRYRGFWRPIATGGNLSAYKLISDTLFANGYTTRARLKQGLDSLAATKGTVNSVGLTMPVAFNVANSPITSSGTIAVTAAGNATQYIRGDGALATLPTSGSGGGASVSYYLNGSVNQGTIGGVTYYEMNKTPIIGAGTDFSINADGYIASFLTDANDPALLKIPAGNWNFETFFSASSGGGTPTFYLELYKYNGTTFTLIASNSTSPKLISDGTNIEAYFSTLAVPETVLTLTDRLAVRIYVSHSGRTITLHTENGHLCQIITTFTTGLTALNGLTEQVQYFSTGTSGTDFNIASSVATHTFNLPTASATNRGALSSANWTTFNNKIGPSDTAAMLAPYYRTATATAALATKLNISDTAAMLSPYARTANLPSLAPYKLISDTLFNNGYTTRGTTKKVIDSLAALELNISDTAAMLLGYTRVQRFTDSLTNVQSRIQTKQNILTLTTTGTSGAATLVGATLNIPNYAPDLSGYVPTSRTITINGTSQDLSANRTFNVGTVTSVTASSPLASSGGTTPNITITQASGSTNGFLSSTDWTTFNNKQNALTNPVTGTGTTNYLPKFTGSTTVGNSQVFDNGTNVGIGTTSPAYRLDVQNTSGFDLRFKTTSLGGTVGILLEANNDFSGTSQAYVKAILGGGNGQSTLTFGTATNVGDITASEKMRITSGGNLLLGTTTDNGARLQVSGSATISNQLTAVFGYFSGTGSGPFNSQITLNNTTSSPALITFQNTVNGHAFGFNSTGTPRFTFINGGLTEIASISQTGAATFSSSVTANGNSVVIRGGGTNNTVISSSTLWGDTAPIISVYNSSTTTNTGAGFQMQVGGGSAIAGILGIAESTSQAALGFYTGGSGTVAEKMRITSGGNVLVGTTTDNGARLQVSGNQTISGTLGVTGAATFSSSVTAGGDIKNPYAILRGDGLEQWQGASDASEISINYVGYNSGTAYFRNFSVYNGKGSKILGIVGSTGAATFSSSVTAGGDLTVRGLGKFGNAANPTSVTVHGNFGLNLVSNNSGVNNITFYASDSTTNNAGLGFGSSAPNDLWMYNNKSGDILFFATSGVQSFRLNSSSSLLYGGGLTVGAQGNGTSGSNFYKLGYGTSASSRSWRMVQDITANGDLAIQQSTTQTGNTYANALYFDASRNATFSSLGTGTVYSNGGTLTNTNPSDSALKNTIKDYTYGLNEILQLKPKTYYYNTDSSKLMLKYGFIAQEVKSIMPDAVRKLEPNKSDSKLGLETDAIYVALINAIKTLEARIKVLETKQ